MGSCLTLCLKYSTLYVIFIFSSQINITPIRYKEQDSQSITYCVYVSSIIPEGWETVPLCVVTHYQDITIGAHQAPVLLEEFYRYKFDQWDLTTLRIVQYITGFNHVDRIADLASMALELVKECIKHLVCLKVCLLIPVFQCKDDCYNLEMYL